MISETAKASSSSVTLEDILLAREARASVQQKWLDRFAQPVVSTTLVWPGEVKDTPLARQVMTQANESLNQTLHKHRWRVTRQEMRFLPTGPEAFWSVSAPAWMIKHVTAHLEDNHPLGRLWDIDVFCPSAGLVKRSAINQPMRRCFICHEPAHVCSRMRRHAPQELAQVIEDLIYDYFSGQR
jgi:holo-ACP synthase